MMNKDKYETVIGLEVHAQLLTASKLFCGDSAAFGGEPNTHISEITLGYPGTLPKLNRHAVELAVRLGIACSCEIAPINYFARKNYFYPDLSKGYQTSQHTTPVCSGGFVPIKSGGSIKNIILNRIHLEEDAGKSLHEVEPGNTCIDYNRAGVALVEIVTEPVIHSGEDAAAYLNELRKLVRWLNVCDGNMEEGSLRCDANVSIRPTGDTALGTRVEVKNLNSIRNVRKAIEYEVQRMIEMAERGERVLQQTRSFDAATDTTFALRSKEEANDYRYFTDPDLPPFLLTEAYCAAARRNMPELPAQLADTFRRTYGLGEYDCAVICEDRASVDYFQRVIVHTSHYKAVANWLCGPVKSYLNEQHAGLDAFPVSPETMGALVELVESGRISFSLASSKLLPAILASGDTDPAGTATRLNLLQDAGDAEVNAWIAEVLARMPDKVEAYKKGKKGLLGLFMGEVKKISKGKADPKTTTALLTEQLNNA